MVKYKSMLVWSKSELFLRPTKVRFGFGIYDKDLGERLKVRI